MLPGLRRLTDRAAARYRPGAASAPSAPIEGNSHAHLLAPLEQLARGLGYSVIWSPELPGGAKGLCRRKERQVEVLSSIAPDYGVSVLVHELCHALVGEKGELAAIDYALEEIVVESAIFCSGSPGCRPACWTRRW